MPFVNEAKHMKHDISLKKQIRKASTDDVIVRGQKLKDSLGKNKG
jgi:hypothetical protein